VDLHGAVHRPGIDVAETRLRDRGGARRLAWPVVVRVRGVPYERARRLDLRDHLRRHVLEGLERADGPAELLAHLRVLDRHLERALGAAEAVGRDQQRTEIDETGEQRGAVALAP